MIVTPGCGDNGGWLKRLLMWDWHAISFDGWPGWERAAADGGKYPHYVKVRVRHGTDPSTHRMAAQFDDVATAAFYHRDHTDDGIPFVRADDVYHGSFWFATRSDAERFRTAWQPYVVETNFNAPNGGAN